jgi:hypothetical protein
MDGDMLARLQAFAAKAGLRPEVAHAMAARMAGTAAEAHTPAKAPARQTHETPPKALPGPAAGNKRQAPDQATPQGNKARRASDGGYAEAGGCQDRRGGRAAVCR